MRFDLTINEFCKDSYFKKELLVYGENFWRPYCHVDDFGKAFNTVLNSAKNKVAYEVFNVGDKDQNFTKLMIVKQIKKIIPDLRVNFVKVNEDPRDYRVNFDKIEKVLGFKISKDVPTGIDEIINYVSHYKEDFFDHKNFYNIPKKNG
jgi:nucleoside-diphosphate-sugar epimerase